ncbi:MAG TPA: Gfo/Idh/MocA family oxidoreductase [Longimicrobiaceae bacterium]|nr:Gfo/Idh/MocA family oxidoreductase [Longimicrobiaceae bacterium]
MAPPLGQPPRLAIVGFGRLARSYYLPALRGLGHPGPVAVADPLAASRAAAGAALPGVPVYAAARELLAAQAPDAVLVASPPSTHLETWNEAAAAGVAVFMEKPFLLAHQLAAFAAPAPGGAPLMVDFNRRFWPPYRRVAELVRGGRAGAIQAATLRLHADAARWSTVTSHRQAPGEGGALHDLGSHLLDLAWVVFGREPSAVRARQSGADLHVALGLEGGLTVACEMGYTSGNREQVEIRGSHGTIRVRNPNGAVHFHPAGSRRPHALDRVEDAATLVTRALLGRTMLRESVRAALGEFLAALATGRAPRPGLEDALRNAAWLEAAARSLASGRPERVIHRPHRRHLQPTPGAT